MFFSNPAFASQSNAVAKRGITDERQALNDVLTQWEKEGLGDGKLLFASGKDKPNMGDVAVFGTLRSVEGLPAHSEAIVERGGVIPEWYDRMKEQVYT
jgi:hypothetical protein